MRGDALEAAQILWCYERAQPLAEQGEVVLCLEEKPNIQVLERRCPTYRVRPGLIEKREFEYKRHGTVNFLVKLEVHTGPACPAPWRRTGAPGCRCPTRPPEMPGGGRTEQPGIDASRQPLSSSQP
ncbi:hypothetical protein [Archangium minus]|uniref:hypothetical protein n=1 Tax=Archangium minus TaxID=83450 RepID=UPI0037C16A48